MSQGKCTGKPLKNQRTLRISPPVRSGSIAAIGRDRRREAHRSCINQEVIVPDSQRMVRSSAVPSTEMDEAKRVKGPRYKQSNCDGNFRHTVRRPIGRRKHLQDDGISVVDWIWKNGLQQYEWEITDFATNMKELLQLEPEELDELAADCKMGIAFRRRLVRGHEALCRNNRDLIRQLSESDLESEKARRRAVEDWSWRPPGNQKSRPKRLKQGQFGEGTTLLKKYSSSTTTEGREGPSLLTQDIPSDRAQFNELLRERLLQLQQSESRGRTETTVANRFNAPTRETVALDCEDLFNYDRTKSPDPFEIMSTSQEENVALGNFLMGDVRAKESEIKDLKCQIANIKQKTEKATNLASPEYEFPKGMESGNQYEDLSNLDDFTSVIGIQTLYPSLEGFMNRRRLPAPQLLDNLLKTQTINPLKDFHRDMITIKGRKIMKNLAPNFDARIDKHVAMMRSIGQHINMDGCILSPVDGQSRSGVVFEDTTDIDRVYALIVSLRDAAHLSKDASALLQYIAQLFIDGVRDEDHTMGL